MANSVPAHLVLHDGAVYSGWSLGTIGETVGELVFNTGMTGYQEIVSDPSYAGQIVTFTYPLIGNYGINEDDFESDRIQPTGLAVHEACEAPSNWRSRYGLHDFLQSRNIVAIQGLDTRAITQHIRSLGVTMSMITPSDPSEALERLAGMTAYGDRNFVQEVTTRVPYQWGPGGKESLDAPSDPALLRLVVIDCGLKFNILRRFRRAGCRPIVLPATASAEEVLAWEPDGILLSPGPGDPALLTPVIQTVKDLLGKRPMFGICLGNQLLCQAVGGTTYKLKFGHRGSNHPVKNLRTGRVTVTSQNHGYAVHPDSLKGTAAEVSEINLNDGTVEGINVPDFQASSIQYHPEAAPGPWDSRPFFSQFVERMAAYRTSLG